MTVTVDEMRPTLLTLDDVRESLGQVEPVRPVVFPMRGNAAPKWKLHPEWNLNLEDKAGTDLIDAFVTVDGTEYRLTKDALLEATSLIGLRKEYVSRTPSKLIEPNINYWYRNTDREEQLLVHENGGTVAVAVAKSGLVPFSNLRLLDKALEGIEANYGKGEVLADHKIRHDLRGTSIRLIVPAQVRSIRPDDDWSAGLQVQNSLIGEKPTVLDGYLFRWICTNGAISTHASSGGWNRRTQGQEGESVYEWARASVDAILGGLEHEFEAVEELAHMELPSEERVSKELQDIFATYHVPTTTRERIINAMIDSGDSTMYGIMQAITLAANDEGLSDGIRTTLMQIGGALPRANANRCKACRRILA